MDTIHTLSTAWPELSLETSREPGGLYDPLHDLHSLVTIGFDKRGSECIGFM